MSTELVGAGTAGIVSTLGPGDDLPTALLMLRFYEGLMAGEPPAAALRKRSCGCAT